MSDELVVREGEVSKVDTSVAACTDAADDTLTPSSPLPTPPTPNKNRR
jgi:hypothetical protein